MDSVEKIEGVFEDFLTSIVLKETNSTELLETIRHAWHKKEKKKEKRERKLMEACEHELNFERF